MSAYCDGDRGAFEHLFARLGPRVHGFFMRSFQSQTLADDLLQTTFMKLHRAREAYRRDQPLRPWLFTIAARVRLDEYRRIKRLPEDLDEERLALADEHQGLAGPVASEGSADGNGRAAQIRAAITDCPNRNG